MPLLDFVEKSEEQIKSEQIRLRIQLSVYAYAYEFDNESLIPDHEFDCMCLKVDPNIKTGNRKMDNFFKKKLDPSTGQWIHVHPERRRIAELYEKYYKPTQT